MSDEQRKIELRSDEVEDILGKVPSWVTRNGVVLLFLVFFLLLAGAWFYKVPDVKRASIAISSLQPPATIQARADGKIEKLLVTDNEKVQKGQILAVIENPADFEDVEGLKVALQDLHLPTDGFPVLNLPVNGNADLGSIQEEYSGFYKNYRDYDEFLKLNYHATKIEVLRTELVKYENYAQQLGVRSSILKEEFELSAKQYKRDSSLFLQNVVSESKLEETKGTMLGKFNSWHEMLSQIAENDIAIAGTNEKIVELELNRQEQLSALSTSMEESFNRLKTAISTWEKEFLIVAPVEGAVTFNSFWSENQNVSIGENVMTIIPGMTNQMVGKIQLPTIGAGEVKIGQDVNVKIDNFPYMEYGMVQAKVRNVSGVPENNFYTVEVEFPNGLETYYGINIELFQNMTGQAEILTDKMRLLQRMFNPLRNMVSRQRKM